MLVIKDVVVIPVLQAQGMHIYRLVEGFAICLLYILTTF